MKGQKANSVRRKYDDEFKLQALKMVENGQSVRSVAQNLGISEILLHNWKRTRHSNRSALEQENSLLKAKLKQIETERDILKKALSIFSRQTWNRFSSSFNKKRKASQSKPCVGCFGSAKALIMAF